MALSLGTIIARRFRLERLAGAGGMGSVYKARDLVNDTYVAIKLLDPQSGQTARFRLEAEILKSLRHPGIVAYIDHGMTADLRSYLIMEWLEGRTLQERLKPGPLSEAETIELGLRVARILAVVHDHGLVHRDLAPGNLLLTEGDSSPAQVTLVDFGLVHSTARMSQLTQEGAILGTPCFMAPEQARGARYVDARADLYSLGAVLFACLTGRPPVTGSNLMALLTKLALEPAPRVRASRPEVSPALDALIERLLAKDPAARPDSAAELADELERIRTSSTTRRMTTGPLSRSEQRFVSLLLIGRQAAGEGELAGVDAEAARHGGELVRLADGTMLAVFAADSAPADMVVRAARCALAVHRLYPEAPMALATGRTVMDTPVLATGEGAMGEVPMGEVIDRAVALLAGQTHALFSAESLSMSGEGWLADLPGGSADGSHDQDGWPNAGIAVDEATASLLEGRFRLHRPGDGQPPELRGELAGDSPAIPATRRLLGKETTCVGREQELAELLAAFEACASTPSARAVVITAPAGAGKTRLAHELRQRLRAHAVQPAVWTGRGDPMAASASLGVLGQLVRSALGVPPTLTASAIDRHGSGPSPGQERGHVLGAGAGQGLGAGAGHVLGLVEQRLGPAGRGIAPFLGEIAGISFAAAEHPGLADARQDAQLMHDRMLQAWLDWLDAETARGPVVCMLDDLQWSDSATLRFCDAALRNLAHRPLLVVALGRGPLASIESSERNPASSSAQPEPGEVSAQPWSELGEVSAQPRPEPGEVSAQPWSELWADRPVVRMSLPPLSVAACLELARQVLPASMDAERLTRLAERSGGNAFFLEELLRSAAHGPSDTASGAASGDPAGKLPDTILAMASARLAALSAEERRVLRAASVFGRSFWREGVAALLGEPAGVVARFLDRLVERELVIYHGARGHTRFAGCAEYTFHHELIREAAHASLTAQDAESGHAVAGHWLEQAGESEPLVLADHYWRGNERERALPWYQRAAEQALEANDWAKVLEYVDRAAQCGAYGTSLGALKLLQAEAENWSAHYQQAYEHGREAMSLLPMDASAWARAAEHTSWAACYSSRVAEVAEVAALLAAHVRGDAHRVALARSAAHLGFCGRLDQARALLAKLEPALEPARSAAVPRVVAAIQHARASLAFIAGHLDEAARWFEHSLASWRASEDHRNACLDAVNLGGILSELGQYDDAILTLRASVHQAERLASEHLLSASQGQLVMALARSHRLDEARELLQQCSSIRTSAWNKAMIYLYGAEIALLESEATLALVRADSAIALCKDGFPPVLAQALARRARALLRLGRVRPALVAAGEGMRILDELGGTLEEGEASLRLVHAEALHAAGQHQEAAAAIRKAQERLEARAALIQSPDWRMSFLGRVADHRRTLELARDWSQSDQAAS